MNSTEIAKLANVSRSTVSRVINNYSNVDPETKKKVLETIEKYGYTPNISARNLAGKANNIIGVFIADIVTDDCKNRKFTGNDSPYNNRFIKEIIKAASKAGFLVLIDIITDNKDISKMESYLSNKLISGGIFIGFPYKNRLLENLAEHTKNVVLIDQLAIKDGGRDRFSLINTNDEYGGYLQTKILIDNGHTNIACITGDNRLSAIERKEGYLRALKEANINVNLNHIVVGNYRLNESYDATVELLKDKSITAIVCANDITAYGAYKAIKESNLKVPEDISLVGFDNLDFTSKMQLDITTCAIDMNYLATTAIESCLLGTKREMIINPFLIERNSILNKK